MIETIVSLETAKLLKEEEFNVNVNTYYDEYNRLQVDKPKNDWNDPLYLGTICSAPTQSLAQQWLRDEKMLVLIIDVDFTELECYYCNIYDKTRVLQEQTKNCITYEEALEEGLKQALKLI